MSGQVAMIHQPPLTEGEIRVKKYFNNAAQAAGIGGDSLKSLLNSISRHQLLYQQKLINGTKEYGFNLKKENSDTSCIHHLDENDMFVVFYDCMFLRKNEFETIEYGKTVATSGDAKAAQDGVFNGHKSMTVGANDRVFHESSNMIYKGEGVTTEIGSEWRSMTNYVISGSAKSEIKFTVVPANTNYIATSSTSPDPVRIGYKMYGFLIPNAANVFGFDSKFFDILP